MSCKFTVNDIMNIPGLGTMMSGELEEGSLSVGDAITVSSPTGYLESSISGIESFADGSMETAEAVCKVSLLVKLDKPPELKHGEVTITKTE